VKYQHPEFIVGVDSIQSFYLYATSLEVLLLFIKLLTNSIKVSLDAKNLK